MSDYCIISDGSCDLSPEVAAAEGVTVVPFYVSFDLVNYKKEGTEVPIRDFYQEMVDRQGVYPKSSLPSVQDFADAFTAAIKKGLGVICICITSKFSGSCQSARNAKDLVLEEYPEARITVIDSMVDTVLQGLFVLEAAKLCRENVPYEQAAERLNAIRESGRIFFTVGSVDYLTKGGRLGKLAGTAVSVLGIKPMITLKEGEIFPAGIARGRKRSMDKAIELLRAYIEEKKITKEEYRFCIGYGYDKDEARNFLVRTADALKDFGLTMSDFPLMQIGATIAVHTGPYPLGLTVIHRA